MQDAVGESQGMVVKGTCARFVLQVHSLANGPEVQKPLMETSRKVSAGLRVLWLRNYFLLKSCWARAWLGLCRVDAPQRRSAAQRPCKGMCRAEGGPARLKCKRSASARMQHQEAATLFARRGQVRGCAKGIAPCVQPSLPEGVKSGVVQRGLLRACSATRTPSALVVMHMQESVHRHTYVHTCSRASWPQCPTCHLAGLPGSHVRLLLLLCLNAAALWPHHEPG